MITFLVKCQVYQNQKDDVSGAGLLRRWERKEMLTEFWWRNLKGRITWKTYVWMEGWE